MESKKNIAILICFLFVSMIGLSGLVSSVTSIDSPTTLFDACSATQNVSVNITGASVIPHQIVSLTFYLGSSSLTANTTWTRIATNNSLNFSLYSTNYTITNINVTSGSFEDANDYVLNVSINVTANGTMLTGDTNTGIRIDCTVPTAASSLTPTADTDGSVTFSGTVVGREVTSCSLVFSGNTPTYGNRSQAMTHTGNTCSLALTSVPEQTYTWLIRATDETNVTDSSTQQTTVDITTGAGRAAQFVAEGEGRPLGGALLSVGEGLGENAPLIIGLVIAGLIIYFIYKKK